MYHLHTQSSWLQYCLPTADPYAAAMDFLQANGLSDMHLDQVAEFIIQNAGEYQGPVDSGPADPFTGIAFTLYYTFGFYCLDIHSHL